MSATAAEISARFDGHPFVDYFDCLTVSIESARRRNKLAVRARLAGRYDEASRHQQHVTDYMKRARQWHDMIDWSEVNG